MAKSLRALFCDADLDLVPAVADAVEADVVVQFDASMPVLVKVRVDGVGEYLHVHGAVRRAVPAGDALARGKFHLRDQNVIRAFEAAHPKRTVLKAERSLAVVVAEHGFFVVDDVPGAPALIHFAVAEEFHIVGAVAAVKSFSCYLDEYVFHFFP